MKPDSLNRLGQPRTAYLYLVSNGSGWAYNARLPRALGGEQKHFAVAKHGGPEAAHASAREWLRKRLPSGWQHANARRHAAGRGTGRSRAKPGWGSLKVGVYRVTMGGREYWNATIYDTDGDKHGMLFSIAKHGRAMALRFAIRKRVAWERVYQQHYSRLDSEDWARLVEIAEVQAGPGRSLTNLDQVEHPGSITQPEPGGYQARIMRRGESKSAYFAFRASGGAYEAHAAAIVWCFDVAANSPDSRRTTVATSRNVSTGVLGVCRRMVNNRRGTRVVIYEASVSKASGSGPLRFEVGPVDSVSPEQERAAFNVARQCRAAYEDWLDGHGSFDRSDWRGWKKRFGLSESKVNHALG